MKLTQIDKYRGGFHLIENPFYTEEVHGPYSFYGLGDFTLEDGGVIPNCTLAYNTFGTLNDAKDNAIVIPTWFSGTNKNYELYIGEGRTLDLNTFFIIIINQIENEISSSLHNSTYLKTMNNF